LSTTADTERAPLEFAPTCTYFYKQTLALALISRIMMPTSMISFQFLP
jgi:hypothetical protein